MNWEDRLRETFSNERAAMEARPMPADRSAPGALRTERTWFSPGLLLAGLGVLCLVVLGAGAYLQNDEPTQNVTATDDGIGDGGSGQVDNDSAEEVPTPGSGMSPEPTAMPPEATPTADPSTPPTVVPQPTLVGGPTVRMDCEVPYGTARVVDVPSDDPDGGLVVHSEAGVSTPVVGVLQFDTVGLSVGPGCATTDDGARWLLIGATPDGASPGGWVNSRFLAEDDGTAGAYYQIFFPRESPEPDADGEVTWAAPVERPVGTTDGRPSAQEALELLFAGPTDTEIAAGFTGLGNPGTREPSDGTCTSPARVTATEDGIAIVQLCVEIMRGGIGDDARIATAIMSTMSLVTGADTVMVLERDGRCFGDLSEEGDGCLQVLAGAEDPAWCDRGIEVGPTPIVTDPPAQDETFANHVAAIGAVDVGPCTLVIIEMNDIGADGQTLLAAGHVPPVAVELAPRSGIHLQFPETVEIAGGPAPVAEWSGGAAVLTSSDNRVGVWIGADQIAGARISVQATPHRLIVSVPHEAPAEASASFTRVSGYFLFPITQDGPGTPVLFEGVGAAFEASGIVVIRDNDGTVVREQRFRTGNPGVAYKFFGVDIELAPGDYELALVACDQCDDELTWMPFTVQ